MNFFIKTLNGSEMSYDSKEDFLKELSLMVDECMENGGTFMEVSVDADASCFAPDLKSWEVSSYNEGTAEQLDYYINERKAGVGDIAYLYSNEESKWSKVNNPRLKSRACGSKPWLTSLSAKSTTLRENI